MPGVHGETAMTSGVYSQPILVRGGGGYTMVGLLGSDADNEALKTCNNWAALPMMKVVGYSRCERTLVLEVDMVYRKAEL